MSYKLKNDDEILADLAKRLDLIRRYKKIRDVDLVARGGTNRVILNKFRRARGGISLKSFVRLLRGVDELDRLESLLKTPEQYSPTGKTSLIAKKRVRKSKSGKTNITWGDDQ